jgi:hypothetical protein
MAFFARGGGAKTAGSPPQELNLDFGPQRRTIRAGFARARSRNEPLRSPASAPASSQRSLSAVPPPPCQVKCYLESDGKQVWKSTGLTNKRQALLVARRWEARAPQERMRSQTSKPIVPAGGYGFSQKEIGLLLKISERVVRQIERQAIEKIKRDPHLYQVWRAYLAGELEEAQTALSPGEVMPCSG